MKRKKTSPDFEKFQREITRRLQAGLPLAGMIVATGLLCGCSERPPRGPIGKMPAKDDSRCEQKSEPQKPKTPPTPNKNANREQCPARTMGGPAPQAEPNRQNETEEEVTGGAVPGPPPSNGKNEKTCPPTPGRPANK